MDRDFRIKSGPVSNGVIVASGTQVRVLAWALDAAGILEDAAGHTIVAAGNRTGNFGPNGIEVNGLTLASSAAQCFVTYGVL